MIQPELQIICLEVEIVAPTALRARPYSQPTFHHAVSRPLRTPCRVILAAATVIAFFDVHLLEKQVCDHAPESRVLKLELVDARRVVDGRTLRLRARPRVGGDARRPARLSPSMAGHNTYAERFGDVTVRSSLSVHSVRLAKQGLNLCCCASSRFHIDRRRQRGWLAPMIVDKQLEAKSGRFAASRLAYSS